MVNLIRNVIQQGNYLEQAGQLANASALPAALYLLPIGINENRITQRIQLNR